MGVETERRTLTAVLCSRWLGCSRQHFYSLLERGDIPGAKKLAGRWFIPREPFERWLAGSAE